MKIRFLLDENLTPRLKIALQRCDPDIDVLRVGDEGAPPLGTLDPDVLQYLQSHERLLVTDNRRTIPAHISEHAAESGYHWGIVWVRPRVRLGALAEALYLIWAASEAHEWRERTEWIPF